MPLVNNANVFPPFVYLLYCFNARHSMQGINPSAEGNAEQYGTPNCEEDKIIVWKIIIFVKCALLLTQAALFLL